MSIPSTITGTTRLYGLIGYPVDHSLSPVIQNAAFRAAGVNGCYVPLPVHPSDVREAILGLSALGFAGVNVTVPHKQAVVPYLHALSPEAQAIGAVNTIVIRDGQRIGYNVDGLGFLATLPPLGLRPAGLRALVLGAGGAARSVVYALANAGAAVTVLNRTPERAEKLVHDLKAHLPSAILTAGPLTAEAIAMVAKEVMLIVNATSVGMGKHSSSISAPAEGRDDSPWPMDVPFPPGAVAYDLIYAPPETPFLREAKAQGARTLNGLPMLIHQGAQAFHLWTGCPAPIEAMFAAAREVCAEGRAP